MLLHAGAQALGAKTVGVGVGGHGEARKGGAPAGVGGAVGEALEGRAALGATLILGLAAHGAKGSRRVGEAERLPCLRSLTSTATRLIQNVAVTPSWKFIPTAGLWRGTEGGGNGNVAVGNCS